MYLVNLSSVVHIVAVDAVVVPTAAKLQRRQPRFLVCTAEILKQKAMAFLNAMIMI